MLKLHVDAQFVSVDALHNLPVPSSTETWQPVSHEIFDQLVKKELSLTGIVVQKAVYGLSKPDAKGYRHRLFGIYHTQDVIIPNEVGAMIGFRNSTDQTLSAGLVFGSKVFVCDNLAFSGQYLIKRRHTKHILDDLPSLIAQGVSRFERHRTFQQQLFEKLKEVSITDTHAHDMFIRAAEARIVSYAGIRQVNDEWLHPAYENFAKRTAWSLFNAFTEVAKRYTPFAQAQRTLTLTRLFGNTFLSEGEHHAH
jgi:hypothetical protein